MRSFYFISIHPKFTLAYNSFGVFKAASRLGIGLEHINLRDFAVDKHGSVDEAPFGGGDGMVLRPEPLKAALDSIPGSKKVFITSPSGRAWKQKDAENFAVSPESLVFIAGRFAGIDERFVELFADENISLGDFIVSGGELPCLMLADSVLRCIPGVLGNSQSSREDSFSGSLTEKLEYPVYTRPLNFEGLTVPDILLSGNHEKIQAWRLNASDKKTKTLRPDLKN